jgi:glycosyltransferase involved in cell wall biosynthesis
LVSIITPAYNTAEFLSQTVSSVLRQTYQNFELLIVNDGSTDRTLELACQWARADGRIHVISRAHGGPSAARNAAIREGRGEYFALLDSDDVWHPTFLEAQMQVFQAYPQADVVTGNAFNLGGDADGRPVNTANAACREITLIDILERENSVFIMSVFRRTVIAAIGSFDEALPLNEDYDFWIRAAHAGCRFVQNPVPLGQYRRRSDSISANELNMLTGIIRVFRSAGSLCADRPREMAAIRRQLVRFEEERLLASAKTNLVSRQFAAAADDFKSLFDARRDFSSAAIARISRWVPAMLLWAYRVKRSFGHPLAAEASHEDRL